jgi:FAD/FMN-containing dehydrogenase
MAGVDIARTVGFSLRRASERVKARRKAAPVAKQAELTLCKGLGIIQDGEEITEQAMAEFAWHFKGRVSDEVLGAMRALFKINEDVVVPVSRIPELVAGVEALAAEFDLPIVAFGHAGNGNLHVNIMYAPDDAAETARAHAALPRLFTLVLALEGTLSGEHGIGVAKRDYMAQAFDTATLDAMRAVKRALDPDGILNPGKVLPEA